MITGPSEAESVIVRPMARWRVRMVYGLIAVIVAGHLFDIVKGHENWPFSNYPMFSILSNEREYDDVVLVGVTDEPWQHEVPLADPAYFAPLPPFHTRWAFQRAQTARTGRRQSLQTLSHDFLKRYNARRAAGEFSGPPLKGVRLYGVHWRLDPWAANVRDPDEKIMLFDSIAPATPMLPMTDPAAAIYREEGKS